jgi:predicted permease
MNSFIQDLRFGARMLRKSPAVSAIAILTFALGIGVNVTIFSVVDAIALRPLDVPEADRIVKILNQDPAHPERGASSSWIELQAMRTESRALAGVTAADRRAVMVKEDDETRLLLTNVVSDNYFDVFRVSPGVGRAFTAAEAGAPNSPPVLLLSYEYWQRRYNGDPGIVGQTIVASDVACTVLGVLPRTFRGTELFLNPDVYVPLSTWLMMVPGDRVRLERPQSRQLEVFGRLQPGVTLAQASAALSSIQQDLAGKYPQQESGRRFDVKSVRNARGPQMEAIAALLLSVAALVLVIACVNVANLLLVRSEARRLEIATRFALGASRYRAVQQLATETLVLAGCGAVAGLLLTMWVINLLPSLMPEMEFRVGFDFRLDARVFVFGALASLIAGLVAGVLPALSTQDVDLAATIKNALNAPGGRRGWWRDGLVVGQITITVVLLIAAGLLVRTLGAIRTLDPGFDSRGSMLIARLDMHKLQVQQEHAYYRAAIERLRALPGVTGSTVASRIPLWGSGGGAAAMAWIPGLPPADADGRRIGFAVVSPGYFPTLGTRIVRGRAITESDNEASALVAVLNESAANLMWPSEDPLGKHFRLNGPSGQDVEVVGLAQDGRYLDLTEPQRAYMFLPLFQEAQLFGSRWGADVLVVRTAADATGQANAVRSALRSVDPNVSVLSMTTMDRHVRSALYGDRLIVQLAGSMGALGLVLAAIGLFGVVSYSVTRRTREIGVRIALGAARSQIMQMVFGRALLLTGIGIALGVGLSIVFGRLMSSVVYGVSVRDPLTFVAAATTMALVTLAGAAIPARRAASIDPIRALRAD